VSLPIQDSVSQQAKVVRVVRRGAAFLAAFLVLAAVATGIAGIRLSRSLSSHLAGEGAILLYSAPAYITQGLPATGEEIVRELRLAGYTGDPSNPTGSFRLTGDSIEVNPGPESYDPGSRVRILLKDGVIAGLSSPATQVSVARYGLEPQPLGRVANGLIERFHPVRFQDVPKVLVNALLSAEDKRFFAHPGFDPLRLLKAAWVNARRGRKEQGGSTLTMQLARILYLRPEKTWSRKLQEIAIAAILETKLSKQQILEQYINNVYLGTRDGISIHGFGQASETYFSHGLSDLSVEEAALLAGMVQRPGYFDPIRHPERALARRNTVLRLMQNNHYLTQAERQRFSQAPSSVTPVDSAIPDDQWFLELAADEGRRLVTRAPQGRLYTTLDSELQRAAVEGVRVGLLEVDKRAARKTGHGLPQVALVAIDSHTGEVKALIGGRDFFQSEVNHSTAQRQPGSVFKPFVYAAALQSKHGSFTAATILNDDPITLKVGSEEYSPTNWGGDHAGQFTMRRALASSNNIATVSLAEQVGFESVLEVALASGLNDRLRATPSLALGSYEVSPLEMAGAYTVFANRGIAIKPKFLAAMRKQADAPVQREDRPVLSPAVAFVMQDLLAEVLRSGTGAGVHQRGFDVAAAGKTGTSRDGWFAGYVSNLICVVWVGYDDNADLDIEGASSALPIWTEFMKRASRRIDFRQPLGAPPSTVVAVRIDTETGLIAGERCKKVRYEYFVRGTEPKQLCTHEPALTQPAEPHSRLIDGSRVRKRVTAFESFMAFSASRTPGTRV
jgi:penicillin-binding protein 1B